MARTPASSDFFLLRTPALPFDMLARSPGAAPEDLEPALDEDRARLREAAPRPEIREAPFSASPDLDLDRLYPSRVLRDRQ